MNIWRVLKVVCTNIKYVYNAAIKKKILLTLYAPITSD